MDDLESSEFFGTVQPVSARDVSAKDRNSVLPVFLQEARDERGRKRLHGAFTGGFSAGYFNTVGSKEGWQPQTFKSSRSSRADKSRVEQKAQDFMDEEDLAELEMARNKSLAAKAEFDILGGTQREIEERKKAAESLAHAIGGADGAIASKIVQDLIIPSSDAIGLRLLRRMGWRDGQGVGPRVDRRKAKLAAELDEDDIHADAHLFAPRDITAVILTGRTGRFGLGYDAFKNAKEFRNEDGGPLEKPKNRIHDEEFDKQARVSFDKRANLNAKAKFGMSGGFGTGIFDDDGEYDEEVYSNSTKKPALSYSIVDDDEDGLSMSLSRRKSEYYDKAETKPPSANALRLGFDGKPALAGFHIASFQITAKIWFDAPKPPLGFVSKSSQASDETTVQVAQYQQKSLTADQRRDILGEEALKGPARSVFSFISQKEQDRLQDFLNKVTTDKKKDEGATKAGLVEDIPVDVETAKAALKGFLPFKNDEAKQARYKRFLELKAELTTAELKHPPHFSAREISHELREFSKSAHMFKPLSSMMSSRFTSSNTDVVQGPEVQAKERVYGAATRATHEFRPAKLLCKRFNIENPFPEPKGAGGSTVQKGFAPEDKQKELLNNEKMGELISMIAVEERNGEAGSSSTGKSVDRHVNEKNDGLDNESKEVSQGIQDSGDMVRPPIDIFKAIFADSESESDESDQEAENSTQNPEIATVPKLDIPKKEQVHGFGGNIIQVSAGNETRKEPSKEPAFRPIFSKKADRLKVESLSASSASVKIPVTGMSTGGEQENSRESQGAETSKLPSNLSTAEEIIVVPATVAPPRTVASWATKAVIGHPSKNSAESVGSTKRPAEDGSDSESGVGNDEGSSEDEKGKSKRKEKRKKSKKEVKAKKEKKEKSSKKRKKDKESSEPGHRHRRERGTYENVGAPADGDMDSGFLLSEGEGVDGWEERAAPPGLGSVHRVSGFALREQEERARIEAAERRGDSAGGGSRLGSGAVPRRPRAADFL
ncbi:hypothetical protein HDU84_001616 [Entophlyctis sp. JEL0112]|nr:hypothetical protein HDU84_001616 [Entophlyctis sp. JEL0112]